MSKDKEVKYSYMLLGKHVEGTGERFERGDTLQLTLAEAESKTFKNKIERLNTVEDQPKVLTDATKQAEKIVEKAKKEAEKVLLEATTKAAKLMEETTKLAKEAKKASSAKSAKPKTEAPEAPEAPEKPAEE